MIKRAPALFYNMLVFVCGCLFLSTLQRTQRSLRPTEPRYPAAVVTITPQIGGESCSVQGVRMGGSTRAYLLKRIGKPIARTGHSDHNELLNNAFVWVDFGVDSPFFDEENARVHSVWFNFNQFSNKYKRKLYLTWKYKGVTYLLDETFTPGSLKSSYRDAFEDEGTIDYNHRVIELCDRSISVHFHNSKISIVSLLGEN